MRGLGFLRAFGFLLAAAAPAAFAQASLQASVAAIAKDARGTVAVACLLPGTDLNCDLNAHAHPPMQSVFKLPLALTVLHLADTGKLLPGQRPTDSLDTVLDRTVRLLPSDLFVSKTYSPLQDRFPKADVDVTVRELLELSAGKSDNAATDLLVRVIGGPGVVQAYIRSLGIAKFQLQDDEHGLDRDNAAQYRNWVEPAAAVQLMHRLATESPLSPRATAFLMGVLTGSTTGPKRMRAGLPEGTVLAHKTGTSGVRGGIAAATNNVGLISLPDGRKLALAVFVTDSRADEGVREGVIARIAKACYEAAIRTK